MTREELLALPLPLPPAPSVEQQKAELEAAGWKHVLRHVWKAPVGGYFVGPRGAWKAMKRREAILAVQEKERRK